MTATIAGRPISFGIWYDFRNPPGSPRSWADLYASTLEHIRYAEQLGFDDIWTSEHHFVEDGYSPSLLPICAAIAAKTTRVVIGTNVLLLPLHDPVRVAEDAATVDVISGGRMRLGVAAGYRLEEFTGFGISRTSRARRMEEAVEVIRRSWAPGPFTFEGRFYRYTGIDVTPKPVQEPMPLWMGGFAEPAVRRAGRLGDGLLAAANVIPAFREAWMQAGRHGEPPVALTLPWTLVTRDPERAWAEYGQHLLYQRRLYAEWFTAAGMPLFPTIPETVEEVRQAAPDAFVTPERARGIVESVVTNLGPTHLYWWGIPPGSDPTATFESLELFAREVLGG